MQKLHYVSRGKKHRRFGIFSFLLVTVMISGMQFPVYGFQMKPYRSTVSSTTLYRSLNRPQNCQSSKIASNILERMGLKHKQDCKSVNRYDRRFTFSSMQMTPTSGIDQLPLWMQTSIFFGIYGALGLSVLPLNNVINKTSKSFIGLEKWRDLFIDTSFPLVLGSLYLTAGIGHFVAMDSFISIYPPLGTWGIWYIPGSASFHVAWTGIVEILGGLGLVGGGAGKVLASLTGDGEGSDDTESGLFTFDKLSIPLSSLVLFVLTIVVTPANIYMYTHGATMGDGPPLDLSFHLLRFAIQAVLLSVLLTLSKDSFFYSWGDELD